MELIGPRAQAWIADLRATYPTATPDALARLATRRFARSADIRAALSALAGPYAPVALLATALITHAELVLHVAAAYGRDPADPRRAADLLALTRVETGGAKRLAGTTAAWAALRYTGRAFPGAGLVAAVLTARSAAESVATRARRYYAENPSGAGSAEDPSGAGVA